MKALLIKEIRSYLSSVIGYASILVFLITTGLFIWVFPGNNNILEMGDATLQSFFSQAPGILMFLIPAITMRYFAEEKRAGTIELLTTKPISDLQIVLSKYLAGCFLTFITLLPTLVYYVSICYMGEVTGNIDHPSTIGSYLGLLLLSMTFVAIGTMSSSIANNQVIAFIIGLFFNFLFYAGFTIIASIIRPPLDYVFLKISMLEHFIAIKRGIIDSRDIIYFFSVIILTLYITKVVFSHKK